MYPQSPGWPITALNEKFEVTGNNFYELSMALDGTRGLSDAILECEGVHDGVHTSRW